ncbi:pyruvate dehydrogenase (acetyl-transferring) E1 component subunit alpha [Dictyobacter alpinus]|uniref:Pyruvate dehydrogenase E1 component subunit alpha n=1 Tax=Dictyobacter alpinus TaxID=2014873 RepID=A0A402B9Q0_9CHLR|nr:pyruvate dehydrogenase (acetyl-transferring) E1 component subunit alpha [Dictyobacter alpinus]GCE28032.1 pyruvate dehydrogenase (acetyl-transferring) E1 component subunit alpha [Dictyobacter alpinus]
MTSTLHEQDIRPPEPISVLAPNGSLQPGMQLEETPELLLEMYRWMTFGRIFDTRLIHLQRQGRLCTYAPVAGQEAAQIGCGLALQQDDWLFSSYRDGLASIVHGLPPEYVPLFFRGHPKAGAIPADVNVFGLQIGIAEQIPHAVGVAWGMKLRRAKTATLAMFGDGATSEGAFHEGTNFAGVFKAPVVLVCQNNGWAISVPRSRQTASETLAQKAVAYGIAGRLVDGNDVLAMYREARAALERARSGQGPTLIEAVTYRFGPHSTADDPQRYQPAGELTEWQDQRDPITRLRICLEREQLWDQTRQKALEEELREYIARSISNALTEEIPAPESMFEQVYAEPTPILQQQRQELLDHLKATQRGVTFP